MKTLKDCKSLEEARQEAIKWRKKLLGEIGFVNKEGEIGRGWIVKFIDIFADITEEDLKEKQK